MTAGARRALVVGVGLGVVLRVIALWAAPHFGYLPDHLDNMAWSSWAATHGAQTIYDMEPEVAPLHRVAIDPNTNLPANYLVFAPHAFNYPPFSAWVFWVKGVLWHALDSDVRTIPVPPALRAAFERHGLAMTVRFPRVNTILARAIDALPSFAFDVLLGLGVMQLVRVLRQAGSEPAAGFSLVFASPVVVLDAALWGQSDSWIASMLVWCLVWWLQGRWVAAGAMYGLALLTKPQAILFAPVLAFGVLALCYRPAGSWKRAGSALGAVPVAVLAVVVVAAPFMIHDARSGARALRWFERSYLGTIGSDEYAYTTLNAFNLWWLDLIAQGPSDETWWSLLDSRVPSPIGLSKDTTAALLLVLAVGAGAVACVRRLRWSEASSVTFAFVVLLSAFLLPTRVHERYVYYCIPFVTALAVQHRAWRPVFLAMSLVGTAEMLSHLFVSAAPASLIGSGTAALMAVAMLPWSYGAIVQNREGGGAETAAAG